MSTEESDLEVEGGCDGQRGAWLEQREAGGDKEEELGYDGSRKERKTDNKMLRR